MTEKSPTSSKSQFSIKAEKLTPNEITINALEFGKEIKALNIVSGDTVVTIQLPIGEQTNTPYVTSSRARVESFEPGHVFRAFELPRSKQYLSGASYVADNPDGTMFVVGREIFAEDDWDKFKKEIIAINERGGRVHMPTNNEWDELVTSPHFNNASLRENRPDLCSAHWIDDRAFLSPDKAGIRYPSDYGKGVYHTFGEGERTAQFFYKNQTARGRWVADVEPFEPV
jgi:hypothetical protein